MTDIMVEVGIAATGLISSVAVTRSGLGDLKERVRSLERKDEELPKNYVPRTEVTALLDSIREITTHTRDMVRAFLFGGKHSAALESLQAAAETLDIGPRGLALIKRSEELRLKAYYDADGVLTIGYGHTGKDVHLDLMITEAEAEDLLHKDVASAVVSVRRLVSRSVALNQHQFDALVDFTFNLGAERLAKSTLLRLVNRADFAGAARQFGLWVHGGGRILPGLVARRQEEAELFLEAV